MSAPADRPEGGHPLIAALVLALAAIAALFLAAGLALAIAAGEVHAPVTHQGLSHPFAAALEGDPGGLLALGAGLLLLLPLARDVAIAGLALKERAPGRAVLAGAGALLLAALYLALWLGAG